MAETVSLIPKLEKRMSDNILALSDEKFEADVINASGPVLVDFWAPVK